MTRTHYMERAADFQESLEVLSHSRAGATAPSRRMIESQCAQSIQYHHLDLSFPSWKYFFVPRDLAVNGMPS